MSGVNLNQPGCCGYAAVEEQYKERREFILACEAAHSWADIERLANELPVAFHNVSALPAALALESAANRIAPVEGGWMATQSGDMKRRA